MVMAFTAHDHLRQRFKPAGGVPVSWSSCLASGFEVSTFAPPTSHIFRL